MPHERFRPQRRLHKPSAFRVRARVQLRPRGAQPKQLSNAYPGRRILHLPPLPWLPVHSRYGRAFRVSGIHSLKSRWAKRRCPAPGRQSQRSRPKESMGRCWPLRLRWIYRQACQFFLRISLLPSLRSSPRQSLRFWLRSLAEQKWLSAFLACLFAEVGQQGTSVAQCWPRSGQTLRTCCPLSFPSFGPQRLPRLLSPRELHLSVSLQPQVLQGRPWPRPPSRRESFPQVSGRQSSLLSLRSCKRPGRLRPLPPPSLFSSRGTRSGSSIPYPLRLRRPCRNALPQWLY